ncbi:surface-adhesin E family protein [Caenimonas aquaedulcis]|uniref:Surface-adhesin protein E-like domain-containing protein n=1 Tax=Caenimonas aquaedulcis TaxID=2793270 RepID=A0A931H361_9BURK|nr:surface-adhesin E family protein [Caenimonas aquaedulcis]MBG9387715.1 hypothetical protein [Caenimonas aquaedulcis]
MIISLLLAAAGATLAPVDAHPWLTIIGDMSDPSVNTIQVNPAPLEPRSAAKTLQVRVSRSANRTSWDGVPYRSYDARVVFDCAQRTARYERIDYYQVPFWKGKPERTVSYVKGEPRMMQFREVEPNPNARIISAACAPAASVARE